MMDHNDGVQVPEKVKMWLLVPCYTRHAGQQALTMIETFRSGIQLYIIFLND